MALQTKTISDTGSRGHHKFSLKVIEDSTSTSNNTSSVTFKFTMTDVKSGWDWYWSSAPVTWSLSIAGKSYSGGIKSYDGSGTITLKSSTITVNHDSDGTKKISYKFSVSSKDYSYLPGSASSSGSMTLTNIARKATLTAAPNFNDEEHPGIAYSNPAGAAVTVLQACIALESGGEPIISYRDIPKTDSSYFFKLTDDEKNILRNACTNSNSRSVWFYIRTKIGDGGYLYSKLEKKFSIVKADPVFTTDQLSYADISSIRNITQNPLMIVQNKSELQASCTKATALKGATISKYEFWLSNNTTNIKTGSTTDDINYIANFGTINSTSNIILYAKATDSRGNYTTISKTVTCLPYYAPSISITPYRSDSVGTKQDGGQYVWCNYIPSFASVNNTNKVTVQLTAIPTVTTATATTVINTITDGSGGVDLKEKNEDVTYKVYATITDSFGGSSNSTISTIYGTQKIINVHPSGTGIGFGKKVESENLFECKWDANFLGNVSFGGESLLNLAHPVGSVFITSTNKNPSETLGGTWTLINKSFTPFAETQNDVFTANSNISDVVCGVVRNDSTIRIRFSCILGYDVTDTQTAIGNFNWQALGVDKIPYALYQYPAGCDKGKAVVLFFVNDASGEVATVEVVGGSTTNGASIYLDFTIPVKHTRMLDEFCDQFYWKRTA